MRPSQRRAVAVATPIAVDVQPSVIPAQRDAFAVGGLRLAAGPILLGRIGLVEDLDRQERRGREYDGDGLFSGKEESLLLVEVLAIATGNRETENVDAGG